MARKRVETNPTDEPEDPFVAWERLMSRRREIDADAMDLISEYQGRIAKVVLTDGLTVATRAARRIRKAPLPSTDVAKAALHSLGVAIWMAGAVIDGREERARLDLAEQNATAQLYRSEPALYLSDGSSTDPRHYAILETGRAAARLLECVHQVLNAEPENFAPRAASIIAHSIKAAELSRGPDERDRIEGAIRSDLKALSKQGRGLLTLWPSNPPDWYDEKEEAKSLSKVGAYVIKELMVKHANNPEPSDDILKGAKLPPRELSPSKDSTPVENLAIAEGHFAKIQQVQFEGIQKLLDVLRGATFKTHEEARGVASRVRTLVQNSGGVLLLSGEFIDGRGRTKTFSKVPVEVRCDDTKNSSFQMKTPDKFKYVTSLPSWPALYIIAKDSLASPQ